ncbi:hypothetical protein ACTU45_28455 [Streptomyces sp. 24-1644]|uniref:hypothetical protein n=1 Tax=Streptomyces sp. 24-1644 TaxID=3457315 RepID=UPI003FA7D8D9
MALAPRAGIAEDMTRDDNGRGFERDETDTSFSQLVDQLVVEGDELAEAAGRRARRKLAEMAPGYERQPVLCLTRGFTFRASTDAPQTLPAPSGSGQLQCDRCQGWFGFTGWTCSACQAVGAQVTPASQPSPVPAPKCGWACPSCGCLNPDGHVSCGYC